MKVQAKHGKVTQNMHGASRNYRYVWDVSATSKVTAQKTGQYIGMYGKSHGKGYITDLLLHAGYINGKLMVLFCRKPIFPSHTTTSQILIYLASPKYG